MTRRTVAVALLALLAAGPGVGARDEPGAGLASYSLAASAPGLALEGLYKDVAVTVPETTATLTTGGVGAALASLAWPGPVVGNLGTTLLVLQPSAPEQVTMLNDPVRAEARTGGAREATHDDLPGTVMTARAEPSQVRARSTTGASLPVGEVGAISGEGSVELQGATTAVARARTAVERLVLAGGVVEVGAVVSTATATSDGTTARSEGATSVTGLTVAGVPVQVDEHGIHVAGQSAANPLPVQAVADAVRALGLTIVLTEPREVKQGSSVRRVNGALVVLWSQGGQEYALTAGRASVAVDAAEAVDEDPVGVTPPPPSGEAPPPGAPATGVPVGGDLAGGSGGESPGGAPSLPPAVEDVVTAMAPLAVALASGAPAPLALLLLLLAGAAGAVLLGRLPARVLAAVPVSDCEESRP